MVQPLWRTVWRFVKKLKADLPYDPAIPLLGIYPEEKHGSKGYMQGTFLVAQWLRICRQCRGHGFQLWSGKIPHAAEQLSPCVTTTETAL